VGVPVVVVVFLLLDPQPAWNTTVPTTAAKKIPNSRRRLREIPAPIIARPETGNQKA